MHLADREVVEVEAQVRRDIGVWRLFVRQHDIQPDGMAARLLRAAVAGLHDSRAAAGDHHILAPVAFQAFFGDAPGQIAGDVVPRGQPLCAALCLRSGNAGTAHENNCGADAAFVHHQLRFQQFQLQAHRAQVFAHHEIRIGEGQPVGRGAGLRGIGTLIRRRDIGSTVTERMGSGWLVFHLGLAGLRGVTSPSIG